MEGTANSAPTTDSASALPTSLQTGMLNAVDQREEEDELEDEDDVDTAPTFIRVEDLATHGVHASEISKLLKVRFLPALGRAHHASVAAWTFDGRSSSERVDARTDRCTGDFD